MVLEIDENSIVAAGATTLSQANFPNHIDFKI